MLDWVKHSIPSEYEEAKGQSCIITIESRPQYCDRGNYIAKLHPYGKLATEIDDADGWPRYFFDIERAKLECFDWLKKRNQLCSSSS